MTTALEIEEYPISKLAVSSLRFDETNPNRPTKEQIAAIRKSFQRFGFLVPIIVNENMEIADGEHRALIYKELGLAEIPGYIVPKVNDDIERRLLRQTMNKLRGEHEIKMDASELALIFQNKKLETLAELIAQGKEELQRTISRGRPDLQFAIAEDTEHLDKLIDAEMKRMSPDSTLGDVYQLGEHRIICADSTDDRSIRKLLNDRRVDMIFTDPPYNIMGSSNGMTKQDDDNMVRPFFRAIMLLIANTLKLDGHAYICCNWRSYLPIALEAKAAELEAKNLIVWHKPNVRLGNMYVSSHEFIFFLANEAHQSRLNPTVNERKVRTISMSESNVWTLAVDTGHERQHFAEKPVALIAKAIRNSSDEDDVVFDPFIGSGSTLMACEQTGRTCYAVEIDPHYVDVTVKRWEAYTHRKATKLGGDG